MAARYVRKLALLAKIETSYGVDPTPSGAANAILATAVNVNPLEGGEERRDLLLPYLGHQGVILTSNHASIEFSVEMAGSGAAGTAPAYGPLLRACGLTETVDTGVSVSYEPVSAAYEAVTFHYNLDGVRHIFLGSRGALSFELVPQQIPRFRFRYLGLLGALSDTDLPALTLSAFKKPVVVNKANTTFSLHGVTPPMERFAFDLGGQVNPSLLVNWEEIEISDRQATGSATVRAALLATKNWFTAAQAGTRDALSIVHGTAAGNIVELAAAKIEIGRPTQGATQGIANYTLPLMLCPDAGNDEFAIIVR